MAEAPKIVRVLVYTDGAAEYRFTAYAENGEPIVVSSEGYVHRGDARGAAAALFPDAEIVEES